MSDIIRVGYISNVNYAEGTAQVVYKDRDNAVSPYLPFTSNEYDPPETDTLVYVVHERKPSARRKKRNLAKRFRRRKLYPVR